MVAGYPHATPWANAGLSDKVRSCAEIAGHSRRERWHAGRTQNASVAWPALILAGLVFAFGPATGRLGRGGPVGLALACGALAVLVLALVLQCWVAHPDRDFESLRVFLGFTLGVLAHVPLVIGLVLLGVAARRGRVPTRAPGLVLLVGILVLPSLVLAIYLQDTVSTGGRTWDLALTATQLPLTLAWVLLGWAVWSDVTTSAGAG